MSPGIAESPHGGKISPAEKLWGKMRFHPAVPHQQKRQSEGSSPLLPLTPPETMC